MSKTNVVHVGIPFAKSGLVDFTCPFCESVHHCSFMLLPVLNFLNGYVFVTKSPRMIAYCMQSQVFCFGGIYCICAQLS